MLHHTIQTYTPTPLQNSVRTGHLQSIRNRTEFLNNLKRPIILHEQFLASSRLIPEQSQGMRVKKHQISYIKFESQSTLIICSPLEMLPEHQCLLSSVLIRVEWLSHFQSALTQSFLSGGATIGLRKFFALGWPGDRFRQMKNCGSCDRSIPSE